MTLLLLSLAVLWTAPWIYHVVRRYARLHKWFDGVLLAGTAGIVLLDILPDSYIAVGWTSLLVAALGLALPSLVERAWHRLAHQVHWFPFVLGTIGLAAHAAIDGAAFVEPEDLGHGMTAHQHFHALPLAVLVHRFFEGLFLWWFLRPRIGLKGAAAVLAFSASCSVVGYWLGDRFFHALEGAAAFAYFQALVGGSLLHLVIDRHDPHEAHQHHHHGHGHDHHDHEAHG